MNMWKAGNSAEKTGLAAHSQRKGKAMRRNLALITVLVFTLAGNAWAWSGDVIADFGGLPNFLLFLAVVAMFLIVKYGAPFLPLLGLLPLVVGLVWMAWIVGKGARERRRGEMVR